MPDEKEHVRHNAKVDFDVTGEAGHVVSGAVSVRSPAQDEAPSPRLHVYPPEGYTPTDTYGAGEETTGLDGASV